jgi:hypothetical protein
MTIYYCFRLETPPIWRAMLPHLYSPQEHGGPVTPLGTGFPFRRLLRFAGLRWRYPNLPPHGHQLDGRVRVTLRLAVYRQLVRLGFKPLETYDQCLFFQQNTYGYTPYVTSSLMRGWVCRLQLLLTFASAVILGSESRGTHDHILQSQIRDSSNLEGQVTVLISPMHSVDQLYPRALGSLFVSSYDSQGYAGGIRSSLHTGINSLLLTVLLITSRHGQYRKHPVSIVNLLLRAHSFPRERVYRAVAQKRQLYIRLLPSNGSIRHNIMLSSQNELVRVRL